MNILQVDMAMTATGSYSVDLMGARGAEAMAATTYVHYSLFIDELLDGFPTALCDHCSSHR